MEPKKIDTRHIGILGDMDATAIAENIKNGLFTEQEVLDCVLERIAFAEPSINAIVAQEHEKGIKGSQGIFSGVPTFIKDLVEVEGMPTRHGSLSIPDNIHKKHNEFVHQILQTGCTIIGKSATSEFGLLPSCETLAHGATHNPHRLGYSTGGSSGGAGALVAAGIVPIAHTMDGGGSTRIPASCCGLIGLKPSRGRHLGSPSKSMPIDIVTHGIVSKTVRDTANYYHAIEQNYPHKKLPPIGLVNAANNKRLKIGVFIDSPVGIESHEDVKKVILRTAQICEGLGHEVSYIKNPYEDKVLLDFLTYYSLLARGIMVGGKFSFNRGFKKKKVERFTKELSSYFSKFMFLAPGAITRLKKKIAQISNQQYEKYDILLSPVLNTSVPKIGFFGNEEPILSMIMKLNAYVNYTIIQNATGAPAISLPMGFCKNGLPIGAMFAAPVGNERTLLELSFEMEKAGIFEMNAKTSEPNVVQKR